MLSYVYKNRIDKKTIQDVCQKTLGLLIIRDDKNGLFMAGKSARVLIQNKYTYIMLNNEQINIRDIERIFKKRKKYGRKEKYN